MNDVRKMIYGTLIGFFITLGFWFSVIYVSACGFTLTCNQAEHIVVRTPIPTLIPVSRPLSQSEAAMPEFDKCQVAADDLIGAWVSAGYSETEAFAFNDVNGQPCEGTFASDIRPLFVENSVWYPGAIGCVSCHNSKLTDRSAGLDLTSYDGMLQGSGRADANAKGNDIFGDGDWGKSALYDALVNQVVNQGLVPQGHSEESPADRLIVFAGQLVEASATPTP